MRRILIDNARHKKSIRYGGGRHQINISMPAPAGNSQTDLDDVIALDEALEKLSAKDKMKADLVKLRYFAGLTLEETAGVLGISHNTADQYWAYARSWLRLEITRGQS